MSVKPENRSPGYARQLKENTIVIASHNSGKVAEFAHLLKPWRVECVSAQELMLPEPVENGTTFADNAILKARAAAYESQLPALADDSGLSVNALGGFPGIYSARWAGPARDFQMAMEKVERKLLHHSDRRASFICTLALAWPDEKLEVFEGQIEGTVIWPPRGTRGFGYDPMFVATGMQQTFGEIHPEIKQTDSHRSRAFFKLAKACLGNTPKKAPGSE